MAPLLRFRGLFFLAFSLGCVLYAASTGWQARAGSFTVDSTVDAVDANPGDGVCATAAGQCTLRAAIQEANALTGADTVILPSGEYAVLIPSLVDDEDTIAEGDLDITADLNIEGAGATAAVVGANDLPAIRVFEVHQGTTVTMSELTVQNGGHVFAHGGGIINSGTLTLNDVVVRGNEGREGGASRTRAHSQLTAVPLSKISG
jgi:CSLREA domain-containing protein